MNYAENIFTAYVPICRSIPCERCLSYIKYCSCNPHASQATLIQVCGGIMRLIREHPELDEQDHLMVENLKDAVVGFMTTQGTIN